MTKTKVTEQRFNTIKRQLRGAGNELEKIAQAHDLKPSTVRFIRGCKDYGTYRRRSSQSAGRVTNTVDQLFDSNLTPEQAKAFLETATDLQTARETIRRLEHAGRTKDSLIASLRAELADCDRRLTATIIENARRKRTLWARIRRAI